MAKAIPLEELPVWHNKYPRTPTDDEFAAGGVLPMDKPYGWSSFDVVKYVRNRIQIRKVGHAGTLDPMASGLLILCCGKATRTISQIQVQKKTYIAEITFGATTPSYDAESPITDRAPVDHIGKADISESLKAHFTGTFEQVPPVYSAIRKHGKRLYELARRGERVEPDPRTVQVHNIELIDYSAPKVLLKIDCGKGFYVRSLAYDLGSSLGTLGYLTSLIRTEIGAFDVNRAWDIESFNRWSPYGRNDSTH